jgi:hypothetical protein
MASSYILLPNELMLLSHIRNFEYYLLLPRSRDNAVGVETGYGLDGPDLIPGSARFFSFPQLPDRL